MSDAGAVWTTLMVLDFLWHDENQLRQTSSSNNNNSSSSNNNSSSSSMWTNKLEFSHTKLNKQSCLWSHFFQNNIQKRLFQWGHGWVAWLWVGGEHPTLPHPARPELTPAQATPNEGFKSHRVASCRKISHEFCAQKNRRQTRQIKAENKLRSEAW